MASNGPFDRTVENGHHSSKGRKGRRLCAIGETERLDFNAEVTEVAEDTENGLIGCRDGVQYIAPLQGRDNIKKEQRRPDVSG